MADTPREQKLAVARKKLRQFQKKKGTRRVAGNGSKESTPEENVLEDSSHISESGTLSSRASSTDLASEDFIDPQTDSPPTGAQKEAEARVIFTATTNEDERNLYLHRNSHPRANETNEKDSAFISEKSTEIEGVCLNNTPNSSQVIYNENQVPVTLSSNEEANGISQNNSLIYRDVIHQNNGTVPIEPGVIVSSSHNSFMPHTQASVNLISNAPVTHSQAVNLNPLSNTNVSPIISMPHSEVVSVNPISNMSHTEASSMNPSSNISVNSISNTPYTEATTVNLINSAPHTETATVNPLSNIPHTENIKYSYGHPVANVSESNIISLNAPEASDAPDSPELVDGGEGGSVSSETTASMTTAIHVAGGDGNTGLKSSSESLRQISLQLSGLMSESEATGPVTRDPTVSELERRNNELAALLLKESEKSQQHEQQIIHLKSHVERLESEVTSTRAMNSAGSGGTRDAEGLREQLQVHIQTIGILVAEKSELQSNLTHTTHALTQRAGEVAELEGRLAGARQRAEEAEAEARDLSSQVHATRQSLSSVTSDLDSARTAAFKNNKLTEDLKTSVAELTERLSMKTKEYDSLLNQLTDAKSTLAMKELHIQQLRDGSREEIQTQLIASQGREAEVQRQLEEVRAALSRAQAENKQVAGQYQQYTSQLAAQTQALQDQIAALTKHNDELQAALEASQANLKTAAAAINEGEKEGTGEGQAELKAENEKLNATVAEFQQHTLQLKEQNAAMTNDNSQLSRLVEQLSTKVEELEVEAERRGTEEVDTGKLLEAMQSDKVAAARALSQNRQLKEQLEELQSGFIIMSNKKLELTEKLEKELHTKKALNQEIATINEKLAESKEHLLEKEREAVVLRENSESLGAQLLLARTHSHQDEQQNRIVQQLRQEASTYCDQVDELEQKLRLAKTEIEGLTQQKSEILKVLSENNLQPPNIEIPPLQDSDQENQLEEDSQRRGELLRKVADLTESVHQLELERNHLLTQLEGERSKNTKVHESSITTEGEIINIGFDKFMQLENAHKALEERFSRSMKEMAELSDEKQQLEHVVQQLQLETETIGDYITIYQFQRGVMKQQARERELELARLKHDREEMKTKLTTLQDLVSALGQEKGADIDRLSRMTNIIHSHTSVPNGLENVKMEAEENEKNTQVETIEPNDTHSETVNTDDRGSKANIGETEDTICHHHQQTQEDSGGKAEGSKSPTVQRILDLLNEMEASSQVEHCGLQKFHPCPLCSGKLITV